MTDWRPVRKWWGGAAAGVAALVATLILALNDVGIDGPVGALIALAATLAGVYLRRSEPAPVAPPDPPYPTAPK